MPRPRTMTESSLEVIESILPETYLAKESEIESLFLEGLQGIKSHDQIIKELNKYASPPLPMDRSYFVMTGELSQEEKLIEVRVLLGLVLSRAYDYGHRKYLLNAQREAFRE